MQGQVHGKTRGRWLAAMVALALLALLAWWRSGERGAAPRPAEVRRTEPVAEPPAPPPAKARPPAAPDDDDSGRVEGRVLDGVTHEGVADAELTFTGDAGVATFRTSSDGTFELTPAPTGSLTLATITAQGYLPYAPGLGHATTRVALTRGRVIHGVTLVLYPAVEYHGQVIDARGDAVVGARVRVLHGAIDPPVDIPGEEWTTDAKGRFAFHAADDAVLEASRGALRGWGEIDGRAQLLKWVTIRLGRAPGDATITGRVRDASGAAVAGALVRAGPPYRYGGATAQFATTGPDGGFAIGGLDRAAYDVSCEAEDRLPAVREGVLGGTRGVELVLRPGMEIAGQVVDDTGAPVPVFALSVRRRAGIDRIPVAGESRIDPLGRFAVRVAPGDYDLEAAARGHARIATTRAAAGATGVRIVLGRGARLRGQVRAGDDHAPIDRARVEYEFAPGRRGGPLPSDTATVTRADGTFELTDIPVGALAVRVHADGFHSRIEGGMTARDGAVLGPIAIELARVAPDERPGTEMVGIGVGLIPDGDALRVVRLVPYGGAFDAGLDYGDRIVAIDGAPVAPLGLDDALARLKGTVGTTVAITVRRDDRDLQLIVERRLVFTMSPRASRGSG